MAACPDAYTTNVRHEMEMYNRDLMAKLTRMESQLAQLGTVNQSLSTINQSICQTGTNIVTLAGYLNNIITGQQALLTKLDEIFTNIQETNRIIIASQQRIR